MAEIIHAPSISLVRRTLPAGAVEVVRTPAAPQVAAVPAGQPAPAAPAVALQEAAQAAQREAELAAQQARQAAALAAEQARREAELAMQKAAEEAARAEEQAKVDAVYEEARKRGYEAGLAQGTRAGTEQHEKASQRMLKAAQALEKAIADGLADVEEPAVQIAFEAICAVLGDAYGSSEGVQAHVRQVVAGARTREMLRIRLHPHDLALIGQADMASGRVQGAGVTWIADESLETAGCVVGADGGDLDARLDGVLAAFKDALAAARRAPPSAPAASAEGAA